MAKHKAGGKGRRDGEPDKKAEQARQAKRERDEQMLRDLQDDLDKVRASAGIPRKRWFGRS